MRRQVCILCLLLLWIGTACAQQSNIKEDSMLAWVLDEARITLRVTLPGAG